MAKANLFPFFIFKNHLKSTGRITCRFRQHFGEAFNSLQCKFCGQMHKQRKSLFTRRHWGEKCCAERLWVVPPGRETSKLHRFLSIRDTFCLKLQVYQLYRKQEQNTVGGTSNIYMTKSSPSQRRQGGPVRKPAGLHPSLSAQASVTLSTISLAFSQLSHLS